MCSGFVALQNVGLVDSLERLFAASQGRAKLPPLDLNAITNAAKQECLKVMQILCLHLFMVNSEFLLLLLQYLD